MLNTDICSCSVNLVDETAIGRAILDLFSRGDIDIISPYRTSREEVAAIIPLCAETSSSKLVDMSALLAKFSTEYFAKDQSDTITDATKSRIKNSALIACQVVERCFRVTSGALCNQLL